MTNPFGGDNTATSGPFRENDNYEQGGYGPYGGGNYGAGGDHGAGSNGLPQYGAQPQQPYGYGYQGAPPAGGMTAVQPVDAFGAIGQAFKGTFSNFGPYALAAIVHGLIIFVLAFIPLLIGGASAALTSPSTYDPYTGGVDMTSEENVGPFVIMMFGIIVAILYQFWMLANFLTAAKISADGAKPRFKDFFQGGPTFGVAIVILVTSIIVAIGTILLIVPGIIAAILLFPASAIKAEEPDASLGECLQRSLSLVKENLGLAALFCISLAVISVLLSMVPFAVIISYPVMGLAMVIFTRQMMQRPVFRWA